MGNEALFIQNYYDLPQVGPLVNYATLRDQNDIQRAMNILVSDATRNGTLNCLDALVDPSFLEQQDFYTPLSQAAARILNKDSITPQELYKMWMSYTLFSRN